MHDSPEIRALAVPQIFGTHSVLCSNLEKRNAVHSSFMRKGTVVPFPFLNEKMTITFYQSLVPKNDQIYLKLYTKFTDSNLRVDLRENCIFRDFFFFNFTFNFSSKHMGKKEQGTRNGNTCVSVPLI